MVHRRVVHILLSLLLLVSQQMAFAHAMSHLAGKLGGSHAAVLAAQPGLDADSDLSSSVAQDGSCSHCLVFAQMANAIGSTPRQFVPLDLALEHGAVSGAAELPRRTQCVFHSRAPPFIV